MADNIDITPGSGATVATDDAGASGHIQLFKLAYAANGTATLVPADADGLKVNLSDTLADPIKVQVSDGAGTGLGGGAANPLVARLSDGASFIGAAVATPLIAKLSDGAAAIGDALARPLYTRLSDGTSAIGSTAQRLHVDSVPKPTTAGGLSMFTSLDLDETEEAVKGSAGQLYGWYIYNDGASEVYVKIYNATTGTVTVGSTAADLTIPIPATSAANVFTDVGIAFGTAITAAATTGVATADASAPAANQVVANFFYS